MKTFKKIIVFVVILGIALLSFLYFGTFSEGTRAGIIMKLSKRGTVVKTWEGQMNLETFGAVKDATNMVTETFKFSVAGDNQELIDELNAVALTGERVNLKYEEKFIQVFWRGDTKVFAIGIERTANPVKKDKDERYPRH